MKILILLTLTLFVVSCSVEKSSSSKSCTINGQAVDCDRYNNTKPGAEKTPVKLLASIKAAISLNESKIDFLENAEDTAIDFKNDRRYECQAIVAAGDSATYSIKGNELRLTNGGGESVTYTRVTYFSGLFGQWQTVERNADTTITTKLNFKKDVLEISVECKF